MRMKELIEQINKKGPDRIMIDDSGESVPPKRTTITPDVIFIRKDRWSLGVPQHLVPLAFGMWEDEWEFALLPPRKLLKIDHFVYLMDQMIKVANKTRLN